MIVAKLPRQFQKHPKQHLQIHSSTSFNEALSDQKVQGCKEFWEHILASSDPEELAQGVQEVYAHPTEATDPRRLLAQIRLRKILYELKSDCHRPK